MPKYKTHLAGGFITFILVVFALQFFISRQALGISIPNSILYLFFCLLGALFPDIDTKSRIQKLLYYPLFLAIIVAILLKNWLLLSVLAIIAMIPILSNHRHLTHRIWFVILIPFCVTSLIIMNLNKQSNILIMNCYLFFVSGAISHLLLDFGLKNLFRRINLR
jgi:membrane-bound metal-dependent hydrolase YbcI (DUF457 family)